MTALLDLLGRIVVARIEEVGRIFLFLLETFRSSLTLPLRWKLIAKQMEFVGVRSISVVVLTGTFTGMVLALQSSYAFRKFGAQSLVGTTVALSMTRELGPVLTSLMVAARAGSAMAAELGTMRVTEQIDALAVMAVDPLRYLVVPRILAAFCDSSLRSAGVPRVPSSPRDMSTIPVECPSAAILASVPPANNSTSSGCAPKANMSSCIS